MAKQSPAFRLNLTTHPQEPSSQGVPQPVAVSTLAGLRRSFTAGSTHPERPPARFNGRTPHPLQPQARRRERNKTSLQMSHPARRSKHQVEPQNPPTPNYQTNPPRPNQLESSHLRHQTRTPRRISAVQPARENVPKSALRGTFWDMESKTKKRTTNRQPKLPNRPTAPKVVRSDRWIATWVDGDTSDWSRLAGAPLGRGIPAKECCG